MGNMENYLRRLSLPKKKNDFLAMRVQAMFKKTCTRAKKQNDFLDMKVQTMIKISTRNKNTSSLEWLQYVISK